MNPADAHALRMSTLASKLDGKQISEVASLGAGEPQVGENSVAAKAPPVEVPADNTPAEAEVTPAAAPVAEVAAPAAAPERIASKLQRSLQLQRKAEEAQRRAKSEGARAQQQRREAESLERQARAREQDLLAKERKLLDIEREYARQVERVKTDPLGFAKEHGVSGADIADYVRSGSDPTARRLDLDRSQMQEALRSIREEYTAQINEIKQGLAQEKQAAVADSAKRNFFAYVEKSEKEVPEQFQAMGVVFSPDELWNRATELADKSERLQLGWDGDRLLEELETEAKSDPRWVKLQARFEPKKTQTKSNVKAETESNAQEEAPKVVVKRETPVRDTSSGQFTRATTPAERHNQRLESIIRTTVLR